MFFHALLPNFSTRRNPPFSHNTAARKCTLAHVFYRRRHHSIIYYYYFPFLPRRRRPKMDFSRTRKTLFDGTRSRTRHTFTYRKNNVTRDGGGDYFHDDGGGIDDEEVSCRCVRAFVGWRSKRNVSARRRTVLRVHAIIIYKRIHNTETTKAELLHVTQLPSGKRRFRRRNT